MGNNPYGPGTVLGSRRAVMRAFDRLDKNSRKLLDTAPFEMDPIGALKIKAGDLPARLAKRAGEIVRQGAWAGPFGSPAMHLRAGATWQPYAPLRSRRAARVDPRVLAMIPRHWRDLADVPPCAPRGWG